MLIKQITSDISRYKYGEDIGFSKALLVSLTKLGFWAVLNYRVWRYFREKTSKVPLLNLFVRFLSLLCKLFIQIVTGIEISYSAQIKEGLLIAHFSNVFIGDGVEIGSNATLHQGVTIGVSGRKKRGVPVIGDDFFAGANAVIVGPVSVGNSVIVAANTLIYQDVDSKKVVSCAPAVVINRKGSRGA
jgi:serine O-acetyltransferase